MSQGFDSNVLDLVKQKGIYLYEYMSDFKKFKEELPSKERFYSYLTGKNISYKEYEHVLNVWNKFEMKMMKDYHNLCLKYDVLLLVKMCQYLHIYIYGDIDTSWLIIKRHILNTSCDNLSSFSFQIYSKH